MSTLALISAEAMAWGVGTRWEEQLDRRPTAQQAARIAPLKWTLHSGAALYGAYIRRRLERLERASPDLRFGILGTPEPETLANRRPVLVLDGIRSEVAGDEIERAAARMADFAIRPTTWGGDVTCDGISPLQSLYAFLTARFSRQLLLLSKIEELVDVDGLCGLYLETPSFADGVVREWARDRRIPCKALAPSVAEWAAGLAPLGGQLAPLPSAEPLPESVPGTPMLAPLGLSSFPAFAAVARELQRQGMAFTVLVPARWRQAVATQFPAGCIVVALESFVDDSTKRASRNAIEAASRLFSTAGDLPSVPDTGHRNAAAVWSAFSRRPWHVMRRQYAIAAERAPLYARALGRIRPSGVLLCADHTPIGHPLVELCRARGIETTRLEGGWIGQQLFATTIRPQGAGWRLSADNLVVSFDETLERLVELGIPKERLWKTGLARLDAFDRSPAHARALRESMGIAPDARVLFFAAPQRAFSLMAIAEAVRSVPHTTLLIKGHPNDHQFDGERVRAQLAALGVACRIADRGADALDLILASDVILCGYTAAILEALLLKRLVIVDQIMPDGRFTPSRGSPLNVCQRAEAILTVYTEGELIDALRRVLEDEALRTRLAERGASLVEAEGWNHSPAARSIVQRFFDTAGGQPDVPNPIARARTA
ncbi:MAG TPA: hypothetical protein VGM67_02625 [Gemmatimonadaceae bacterium]